MTSHNNEAAELRANVASLGQETNSLLTRATTLKVNTEEMGERIKQLSSHNLDVAHAGHLLISGMEDDFRALFNKYILTIRILEEYANKL